jgi:hypothetical protein
MSKRKIKIVDGKIFVGGRVFSMSGDEIHIDREKILIPIPRDVARAITETIDHAMSKYLIEASLATGALRWLTPKPLTPVKISNRCSRPINTITLTSGDTPVTGDSNEMYGATGSEMTSGVAMTANLETASGLETRCEPGRGLGRTRSECIAEDRHRKFLEEYRPLPKLFLTGESKMGKQRVIVIEGFLDARKSDPCSNKHDSQIIALLPNPRASVHIITA